MLKLKRYHILAFGLIPVMGLVYLYKKLNPLQYDFFPKCPIKHATGYDCPGCGGQRAFHHLLNGEVKLAFLQNPVLFILVPYIFIGLYLHYIPNPSLTELKTRKLLFGEHAIKIVFIIILGFTIVRNLLQG